MVFKNIITILVLIVFFCVLLWLGFWQLDRLQWKTDILQKIEMQNNTDPMVTKIDLTLNQEFQRGYLIGQFIDKPSLHLAPRTNDGMVGYHIISPFKTTDGQYILVNRGWVENNNDNPPLSFPTKIGGYLMTPDKVGTFTPPNRPDQNLWYAINFDDVRKYYDDTYHNRVFYLQSPPSDAPRTFITMPQPRNKHMQYAIFWFFMAGLLPILVCVFKIKK